MPDHDDKFTIARNPYRTVLVTGISGFLGGAIARRLKDQGCKVRGLCRSPQPHLESQEFEMVYADLANPVAMRSACEGMDTVFHAAAKVGVWGKYRDFRDANVIGTQAIINGCRDFQVGKLIYTSTPSVVFNGDDIAGENETLPYGREIPCHYPKTKAIAEKAVLEAHLLPPGNLKTVALRPHLIWGPGDRHLVPRMLQRAREGRLRKVGDGANKVDLTYIDNAVDAHLLAEAGLDRKSDNPGGKAYFISNDEPVNLWSWINELLVRSGMESVKKSISLKKAYRIGILMEAVWTVLRLNGEPPMTRFVASELAKNHWFDIFAAKRDLGYQPRISMEEGMKQLLSFSE